MRTIRLELCRLRSEERGFTLVELLIGFLFVGILSVIAMSSFYVYKEDVEYAKAEATLRNARTSFGAFEADEHRSPGISLALTYSALDGSPLPVAMERILPGGSSSDGVRLGALFNGCDGEPPGSQKVVLLAQPCSAPRYVAWLKRCDGLEVLLPNVGQPDVC